MNKNHTLFLFLVCALHNIQPETSKKTQPSQANHVAQFLDETLQAKENNSQNFYHIEVETVWTCVPWWHTLLAYIGLMKDGQSSTDISSYCFRDHTFENKQQNDPDYDPIFQDRPKNIEQAYHWFRESMATLRFKHKTDNLINFSITSTENTPSYTYNENPNYPITNMKNGYKITYPFGTPTEKAKSLHDQAFQELASKLHDLPDGEQKELEIPGHGLFKCMRSNLCHNTRYSCNKD